MFIHQRKKNTSIFRMIHESNSGILEFLNSSNKMKNRIKEIIKENIIKKDK